MRSLLVCGGAALLAQPVEQAGQAETLAVLDVVEHLAEVVEVGQQPLAVGPGEHPRGQPVGGDRLVDRRDAARAQHVEPAAYALGDVVGQVVAAGVELLGGQPDERGQRHRPHPRRAVRLLERLEQAPASRPPASVSSTLLPPLTTDGMPRSESARWNRPTCLRL